jgi:uncharacterized repeat protein (TIGR01451 family)
MERPRVKIEAVTECEVTVSKEGGPVTQRVPTGIIDAGSILFYTINLSNEGDEPTRNLTVENPIPRGSVYVPGSATGQGSTVLISNDHGASFVAETEAACWRPESVTDVRWIVEHMPPGTRSHVEFQVRILAPEPSFVERCWSTAYLWLLARFST